MRALLYRLVLVVQRPEQMASVVSRQDRTLTNSVLGKLEARDIEARAGTSSGYPRRPTAGYLW